MGLLANAKLIHGSLHVSLAAYVDQQPIGTKLMHRNIHKGAMDEKREYELDAGSCIAIAGHSGQDSGVFAGKYRSLYVGISVPMSKVNPWPCLDS